jgi:hypothetical protein
MMKTRFIIILFFICNIVNAQNYKWVTGGGSSTDMTYGRDWEQAQYMCTDDNNNVYVLSSVGDDDIKTDTFYIAHAHNAGLGNYPHMLLASYNCSGKLRWAKLFESVRNSERYGLVYENGSIYVHGAMRGGNKYIGSDTNISAQYINVYLSKFDTSGKLKWIKFIGPDSVNTDRSIGGGSGYYSIAIDGNSNIHLFDWMEHNVQITPTVRSTTGVYDIKYDTSGNLLSAIKMPIDSVMMVNKVVINKNSDMAYAVINEIPAYITSWNVNYIASFDSSDNVLWTDTVHSGSIFDIDYDGSGKSLFGVGGGIPLIVGADTITKTYLTDFIKIDTDGHSSLVAGLYGSGASLFRITLMPTGQLAATTHVIYYLASGTDTISPASGQSPVLCIVDTSDSLIKLDQFTSGGFYDWGTAITNDKAGNIYIGGQVQSFITAAGADTFYSTGGNSDFFVAKYGYNCNCSYATMPTDSFAVNGAGKHVPDTVHFTYTGSGADSVRWYFGDSTTDTALNPTHIYTDTGTLHVCLTVYGCDSTIYCKDIQTLPPVKINYLTFGEGNTVKVYPNPNKEQFYIEGADIGTTVALFNIIGQRVYAGITSNKKEIVNIGNLSPGAYILQLTDNRGNRLNMRIVKE